MKTPKVTGKDKDLKQKEKEEIDLFFETFSRETDRGFAVTSVCYLDNALEKLIRAAYIKDPKVSNLFRSNQILQTFYNKISITYFSGLIPKAVYHDLMLVGEIRNKFAHGVTANLRFSDENINNKIDRFQELPDTHRNYSPRLKYTLIVTHIGALLRVHRDVLLRIKEHPSIGIDLAGLFNIDVNVLQRCILTPDEIEQLMKKTAGKQESSK
jgi:DNA-binding MltR family transcriptional regulator